MCTNSTRRLSWEQASDVNLQPIFLPEKAFPADSTGSMAVDLTVAHITSSEDYEIFSAIRHKNMSKVFDLIEQHVGVNARDEWGQTPLMVAVQSARIDIVAALLNTRMPKADVNAAKSVSAPFPSLFS